MPRRRKPAVSIPNGWERSGRRAGGRAGHARPGQIRPRHQPVSLADDNVTLSRPGDVFDTILYSTNYISGNMLGFLVTSDNLVLEDLMIWSNPADDGNGFTTTVPLLLYGSTNVVGRRLYIKGESDGIFGTAGASANKPADDGFVGQRH